MINDDLEKKPQNFEKLMTGSKNFKNVSKEITKDQIFSGVKSIVIDIENSLVTKFEIKSKTELDNLKDQDNFEKDYIVIEDIMEAESGKECCEYAGTNDCVCNLHAY